MNNEKGIRLWNKAKAIIPEVHNYYLKDLKCSCLNNGHHIMIGQKDAKYGIWMGTYTPI